MINTMINKIMSDKIIFYSWKNRYGIACKQISPTDCFSLIDGQDRKIGMSMRLPLLFSLMPEMEHLNVHTEKALSISLEFHNKEQGL